MNNTDFYTFSALHYTYIMQKKSKDVQMVINARSNELYYYKKAIPRLYVAWAELKRIGHQEVFIKKHGQNVQKMLNRIVVLIASKRNRNEVSLDIFRDSLFRISLEIARYKTPYLDIPFSIFNQNSQTWKIHK